MKLSIIMPVFNGEKCIEKSIKSVLNQKTNYEYELIIVNDCSTDNTKLIIEKYIEKHDNIKCITNFENIGVNESRNKAIIESRGELIAFLDSDDTWNENKIEEQIQVFNDNLDIGLCFTDFSIYDHFDNYICDNFQYWNHFKKLINKNKNVQIIYKVLPIVLRENIIGTSSVMVRKDALMKTNLFSSELGYSQDWDLWLNLSINNSFAFINKPLMNYYMMPDSITRKKRTKTHLISIVEKYREYCDDLNYSIAKSNCYAFIGESAFLADKKGDAIKFYIKSLTEYFQIYNLKKFIWHLIH